MKSGWILTFTIMILLVASFVHSAVELVYPSAEVKNERARQDGNRVVFEYDLEGDNEAEVSFALMIDGKKYQAKDLHLEGDYGKVRVGKGKIIYWNVLQDFPMGLHGNFEALIGTVGGAIKKEAGHKQVVEEWRPTTSEAIQYAVDVKRPKLTYQASLQGRSGGNTLEQGEFSALEVQVLNEGNLPASGVKVTVKSRDENLKLGQTDSLVGIIPANSRSETIKIPVSTLRRIKVGLAMLDVKITQDDFAPVASQYAINVREEGAVVVDVVDKIVNLSRDSRDMPAERVEMKVKIMEPRPEEKEDPEALYQKGYGETTGREYSRAVVTFQKFLTQYPEHKLAVNAHYWLGEIYYAKGDWEMAILEFDKVIKKYPGAEKTPASLLKQGFAFEKLGSLREAKVLLQEVLDKYPKSNVAPIAKKRLGQIKQN